MHYYTCMINTATSNILLYVPAFIIKFKPMDNFIEDMPARLTQLFHHCSWDYILTDNVYFINFCWHSSFFFCRYNTQRQITSLNHEQAEKQQNTCVIYRLLRKVMIIPRSFLNKQRQYYCSIPLFHRFKSIKRIPGSQP